MTDCELDLIYFCGLENLIMVMLQEANKSLAGERGYAQLKDLQKLLRVRQQYVVSQVSLLYPVKVVVGRASEQELESFTCSKSGNLLVRNLLYICLTLYRTDVLCRFVCVCVCAHNL